MSTPSDSWIHEALAPARRFEPTDAEVLAALRRTAPVRRPLPVARWTVVFALLALVLLTAGAGAATGLLPVGNVFKGDGFGEGPRAPDVKETMVATDVDERLGRWRITTFESPLGGRCMKLELPAAQTRIELRPRRSGYCGPIAAFDAFSHGSNRKAAQRHAVILFGRAPAGAKAVELTAAGDTRVRVETRPAPTEPQSSYWVLTAPNRLDDATLRWIDARGGRRSPIDVSFRFSGPTTPMTVMRGRSRHAGRWRVTASESVRRTSSGDLYSPEALPCLTIIWESPPRGMPKASGGCGEFRNAPGFGRHQKRVPNIGPAKEFILYGWAPERADAVALVARGRRVRVAATQPAPPGGRGVTYWSMTVSPDAVEDARVEWLDRDRGFVGDSIRVFSD